MPTLAPPIDRRVVLIIARGRRSSPPAPRSPRALLTALIGLITNLAFYGRCVVRVRRRPPATTSGAWVVVVPSCGALIVGLMARYGSQAIRGHGIPEAMEQVLTNQSRIPPRMTFLKPLSAAIAIGTGGPFGAEGPIIATGGALGSLIGQLIHDHRRRAQDAARRRRRRRHGRDLRQRRSPRCCSRSSCCCSSTAPRSLIPVALAAVDRHRRAHRRSSARRRRSPCRDLAAAERRRAGAVRRCIGALVGAGVGAASRAPSTRVEDGFEQLPHPLDVVAGARRASPVGVVGCFAPRTLGVGYDNIERHRSAARSPARALARAVRAEVHLVGDRRSAAAPRAARWRRCSPSAAAWARCCGAGSPRVAPGLRHRPAHRRAGRHGGDVRRRLARAAGVGRVRLRDHAPAARPAAAARRLHARRTWSRAC